MWRLRLETSLSQYMMLCETIVHDLSKEDSVSKDLPVSVSNHQSSIMATAIHRVISLGAYQMSPH